MAPDGAMGVAWAACYADRCWCGDPICRVRGSTSTTVTVLLLNQHVTLMQNLASTKIERKKTLARVLYDSAADARSRGDTCNA